ncbi:MAG TPA: response regulator [Gemmatimonadaceae bacterium]|nr:response regulator [Gemmatimonadaceae bacterium]
MTAHVLIVEDSALVVGALRLLLVESGFRVSDAGTVSAAVDAIRREHPDLVLLDLGLRDGDGLRVLADVRGAGETLPVTVAVTGDDEPDTRERCLRAGCRDVLVKPIRAMELPAQITGWLAERTHGARARDTDSATDAG